MRDEFSFRVYPAAIVAFHIRLPQPLRPLQEWLDQSRDGFRDHNWCFFESLDCAEAFNDAYGDLVEYTAVPSPDDLIRSVRWSAPNTFDETMKMLALHRTSMREKAGLE